VAPIPKFAVPFIGAYRAHGRRKLWRSEDYTSPLEAITQQQAEGIREALREKYDGHEYRVHVAFEFRHPDSEETLRRLEEQGSDRLIFVPMYVPISDFSSGISQKDWKAYQEGHPTRLPEPRWVLFRPCLKELAAEMVRYVRQQLSRRGISPDDRKEAGLLLGCHGTLVHPPQGISDSGYQDVFGLYQLLEREFRQEFKAVDIGWLNHRLGGEWTSPTLEDSARRMKEQGIARFVYYPFGFVADNAETQLEGRSVLRNLGIDEYIHLSCMNDDPEFLRFLATQIQDAAHQVTPANTSETQAA
jgi:ferrochelatase